MPKKKANNRLDKLFDEINKEAQLQAENPATHVKKSSKETASESLDLLHPVDFSGGAKKSPVPSEANLPISTMLSTAFRTDDRNWATLKISRRVGATHMGFRGTNAGQAGCRPTFACPGKCSFV